MARSEARTCHAGDDRADGRSAQRRADPQLLEQGTQPELVHRPQSDLLHATQRGRTKLERIDVDSLDIVLVGRRGGAGALAGEQLGGDALGVGFEFRGAIGGELELTGECTSSMRRHSTGQALCPMGKCRPRLSKVPLSHLRADAFGAHEAKGEVRFAGAGATGLGAADEHSAA